MHFFLQLAYEHVVTNQLLITSQSVQLASQKKSIVADVYVLQHTMFPYLHANTLTSFDPNYDEVATTSRRLHTHMARCSR